MKIFGKDIPRRKNDTCAGSRQQHNISEDELKIWIELPERVRNDPFLDAYRKEYEQSTGYAVDDGHRSSQERIDEAYHEKQVVAADNEESSIELVAQMDAKKVINQEKEKVPHTKFQKYFNYCKIGILLAVWILFTVFLMATEEKELTTVPISIPYNTTIMYTIRDDYRSFELQLSGHFSPNIHQNTSHSLTIYAEALSSNSSRWVAMDYWQLPILKTESLLRYARLVKIKRYFNASGNITSELKSIRLVMKTNVDKDFTFQVTIDNDPVNKSVGILYATLILIGLYIFIIWEIVDKTFATLIASTLTISVLAVMGTRPSLSKIMSWIDIETLFLLFGMMIIVGLMSETGLFDFMAVYAYKITKGRAWPLIYCLCLFTAILSAFLDNVTSLLLMAPVSIRLCEIMDLNPIPILMSMILYSNIGGALTPVGDPPNIIIISNSYVSKSGITFTNFILHMIAGVVLACLQAFVQLRIKYRTIDDLRATEPKRIRDLRKDLAVWRQALESISLHSKSDDFIRCALSEKVKFMEKMLNKQLKTGCIPSEEYMSTLVDLQAKYPIKNRPLLMKSLAALFFALGFFFLHSIPGLDRLSLGWIAFLGALLLLIVADTNDMEAILMKIEWSTLLFFASLFVLIEGLSDLGLIDWIGQQTENIIVSVDEKWRLAIAIIIIIWISAVASSFLDNIPLTTMMIKIVVSLAQNQSLGLPLPPLIWALSFGACFGGNGTLIGASANIICASVAEQHGFKLSFYDFFKIGFPMMIGNVLTATVYMMFAHVLFEWH